ncbi:hypothetical protein KY316_00295, partial [Candidatus Woesearchaeota archaeon]|nr:hypothetical protein [Candidatus Woesearchaeota archaeon]
IFCRRTLIKEKYEKEPMLQWELLTFLMHINHGYYYLYKYAAEHKIQKDKNVIEMLRSLEDYYQMFYDSYYKKDTKIMLKINYLKEEFQFGKCITLLEKGKNPVLFSYIREIFRLIQLGTSPIRASLFEQS